MERRICFTVALSMMVLAGVAEEVNGIVGLWLAPTLEEVALAYENADTIDFERIAFGLIAPQAKISRSNVHANKAVVELQELPSLKVYRKTTVDRNCKYSMMTDENHPLSRVFCSYTVDGMTATATAPLEWNNYKKTYTQDIVLRKNYATLIGRCVDTNGAPVTNAIVYTQYVRTPVEQYERWMDKKQIGRTDKDGWWKIDGLERPSSLKLFNFLCNTNIMHRYDSTVPPYGIGIAAYQSFKGGMTASGYVPNVTESDRIGCEKLLAAFKRKTGRDWARPAPLTDFPASTNNVIYIPDMVLTPPQKR